MQTNAFRTKIFQSNNYLKVAEKYLILHKFRIKEKKKKYPMFCLNDLICKKYLIKKNFPNIMNVVFVI